jgi:ATP-dependent DNA ligase
MLAKRVGELPAYGDWVFEPKWDGFRALVFRDGDAILIQSRDEKPLDRYFPELLEPLRSALPPRCVLDGEIVIVKNNEPDHVPVLVDEREQETEPCQTGLRRAKRKPNPIATGRL